MFQLEDQFQLFDDVNDLINASKVPVTDMISAFEFGDDAPYSIRVVHDLTHDMRKALIEEYWKEYLHFEKGFCYTFDPSMHGRALMPVLQGRDKTPISLTLKLKVNMCAKIQ